MVADRIFDVKQCLSIIFLKAFGVPGVTLFAEKLFQYFLCSQRKRGESPHKQNNEGTELYITQGLVS